MIIYLENNKIIIAPKLLEDNPNIVVKKEIDLENLKKLIQLVYTEKVDIFIPLLNLNYDDLIFKFKSQLLFINAGGGLVFNKRNEILFILRNGKWDLPKGKLEKGETIATCALREVKEETGLKNIHISEFFKYTYHVYFLKEKVVFKETTWYVMNTTSEALLPQHEEGIEQAIWVPQENIDELLTNTFASIKDVVYSYFGNK